MALSTQPYKGARDFYPEDKRIQNYMFSKMRQVCESFGYEEYDAPILEPTDLFLAKGNQEIIDEQTYTFLDRGNRSVTIRTEMTPTVSRMVAAKRQELAYPLRWYCIPNVWRYERMQRGRLREFWQLNVDLFGVEGVEADHELILVADSIMKAYGAKPDMYTIRINSCELTKWLLCDYLGFSETQEQLLLRLIDRMHKMEQESFLAQADAILTPSQRETDVLDSLTQLLKVTKLNDLPAGSESLPSVLELKQLSDMLDAAKITNVQFDVSLMRGFDYYTDIVFEVFDTDPANNRAMFGGGRYDGLVGIFGVEPVPTVGFGMGDVTLQNFLETHDLLPNLAPETDAYVIFLGENTYQNSQRVLESWRNEGLRLAVDTTGRKIDRQIKTALKKSIENIIFIGETELADNQYKLKNLTTSVEETHSPERIVTMLMDRRRAWGARPATETTETTSIDI
jgi:histidyl-tRNA synthetase